MRLEEIRGQRRDAAQAFTFRWNGKEVTAYPGETILGSIVASGNHVLRHTRIEGEPRGMLCGIGVCFECLVSVNGRPNRRACMVQVEPAMIVESGRPVALNERG